MSEEKSEFFGDLPKPGENQVSSFEKSFLAENAPVAAPSIPAAPAYAPRPARAVAVDADGQAIKCPKCGSGMVVRPGPKGDFHGCSTYPKCKGSANIAKPMEFLTLADD